MTSPNDAPIHRLAWLKGGHADLVAIDDDAVVLRSTIPSPPGSRLDGRLLESAAGPACDVRVKVHGSKREADGVFVIRGRLIDANRELRVRLASEGQARPEGSG